MTVSIHVFQVTYLENLSDLISTKNVSCNNFLSFIGRYAMQKIIAILFLAGSVCLTIYTSWHSVSSMPGYQHQVSQSAYQIR